MQTLINSLSGINQAAQAMIFSMLSQPLSNVPFHSDTPEVTRFFAPAFPMHLAVHQVSFVRTPPLEYTQPHMHEDHDEINIIISGEELIYKILLGTNEYTVSNNSCIWIPKGVMHSANVLKGSGHFIAMRVS